MANGRRPRRVGLQQNTALDTLERILGLGQGIAQTVQANRKERSNALQIRMTSILDSGQNKEPLHRRTLDNSIIDELKSNFVEAMGSSINGADLETRESYNAIVKDFDRQKQINDKYNLERNYFVNAEDTFIKDVNRFMDIQKNIDIDPSEKTQLLNNIKNQINNYSKKRMSFVNEFGTKINYDPITKGNIESFNLTAQKFLSIGAGMDDETPFIDQQTYNMLMTGLASDNIDIAARAINNYDNLNVQIEKGNIANILGLIQDTQKTFSDAKQTLKNLEKSKDFDDTSQEQIDNATKDYAIEQSLYYGALDRYRASVGKPSENDPRFILKKQIEELEKEADNKNLTVEEFIKILEKEVSVPDRLTENILKNYISFLNEE